MTAPPAPWWLQLPLTQGATRFGPLPPRVVIGSDPDRCHIILSSRSGASPTHLLLEQEDGAWRLSYAGDARVVLRWQDGQLGRPWKSGSAIQEGETIAFGAEGLRLTLVQGFATVDRPTQRLAGATAARAAPPPRVIAAPHTADTAATPRSAAVSPVLAEAQRQAMARARTQVPALQQLDAWTRRLTGRGWKDPVLLVSLAAAMLSAMLGTAGLVAFVGRQL